MGAILTKDGKLKIGDLEINCLEVLKAVDVIKPQFENDFCSKDQQRVRVLIFMIFSMGANFGVQKEWERIKARCDAAEEDFKKIQEMADLIKNIDLMLMSAQGEA